VFARQFLGKVAPSAIKEKADAESGFFIGPEQKCWRKYLETFTEISGVSIEKEIAEILATNAEELILGKGRQGGREREVWSLSVFSDRRSLYALRFMFQAQPTPNR